MYETTYEKSPKSYPSMSDVTTNDEKIEKTVPVESKKGLYFPYFCSCG